MRLPPSPMSCQLPRDRSQQARWWRRSTPHRQHTMWSFGIRCVWPITRAMNCPRFVVDLCVRAHEVRLILGDTHPGSGETGGRSNIYQQRLSTCQGGLLGLVTCPSLPCALASQRWQGRMQVGSRWQRSRHLRRGAYPRRCGWRERGVFGSPPHCLHRVRRSWRYVASRGGNILFCSSAQESTWRVESLSCRKHVDVAMLSSVTCLPVMCSSRGKFRHCQ